jgi:hypothetical protein
MTQAITTMLVPSRIVARGPSVPPISPIDPQVLAMLTYKERVRHDDDVDAQSADRAVALARTVTHGRPIDDEVDQPIRRRWWRRRAARVRARTHVDPVAMERARTTAPWGAADPMTQLGRFR